MYLKINFSILLVHSHASTGIASALKGMSNIAAVASPVTHVSCEMGKDHTVLKKQGIHF